MKGDRSHDCSLELSRSKEKNFLDVLKCIRVLFGETASVLYMIHFGLIYVSIVVQTQQAICLSTFSVLNLERTYLSQIGSCKEIFVGFF